MIKVEEFKSRRERLIDRMSDDSIMILFAGVSKACSADEDFEFVVNRNFLYLTNVEQDASILVLTKTGGLVQQTLYVHEYNELYEKRIGRRLTLDEAKALSGIENCLYINQFESDLSLLFDNNSIKNVYIDLDRELKIDSKKSTKDFANEIKEKHNEVEIKNAYNEVLSLRMVKSEAEVDELREAIKKTKLGLDTLIKALKPGKKEYQMAALFYYTIQDLDKSELSFPTIVSAGVNATCLHYTEAKDELKDGDLILFDLGSRHNTYCADISRTYPINGKFSPLQKKIYEIVLECNKMVIKEAKPGVTLGELNNKVIDFLSDGCLKSGLIKEKEEIKNYYFHSISHHIGLDTHDPVALYGNQKRMDIALEEGHVISNEPGLYFKDLKIGVRIEDDLLITKNGCINLSEDIIKEVEDIEEAFKRR